MHLCAGVMIRTYRNRDKGGFGLTGMGEKGGSDGADTGHLRVLVGAGMVAYPADGAHLYAGGLGSGGCNF